MRAAIDTTQESVIKVYEDRGKTINEMIKTIEIYRNPLEELNKDILKGVVIEEVDEEDSPLPN